MCINCRMIDIEIKKFLNNKKDKRYGMSNVKNEGLIIDDNHVEGNNIMFVITVTKDSYDGVIDDNGNHLTYHHDLMFLQNIERFTRFPNGEFVLYDSKTGKDYKLRYVVKNIEGYTHTHRFEIVS